MKYQAFLPYFVSVGGWVGNVSSCVGGGGVVGVGFMGWVVVGWWVVVGFLIGFGVGGVFVRGGGVGEFWGGV